MATFVHIFELFPLNVKVEYEVFRGYLLCLKRIIRDLNEDLCTSKSLSRVPLINVANVISSLLPKSSGSRLTIRKKIRIFTEFSK